MQEERGESATVKRHKEERCRGGRDRHGDERVLCCVTLPYTFDKSRTTIIYMGSPSFPLRADVGVQSSHMPNPFALKWGMPVPEVCGGDMGVRCMLGCMAALGFLYLLLEGSRCKLWKHFVSWSDM